MPGKIGKRGRAPQQPPTPTRRSWNEPAGDTLRMHALHLDDDQLRLVVATLDSAHGENAHKVLQPIFASDFPDSKMQHTIELLRGMIDEPYETEKT